jgi:hypothetical protein
MDVVAELRPQEAPTRQTFVTPVRASAPVVETTLSVTEGRVSSTIEPRDAKLPTVDSGLWSQQGTAPETIDLGPRAVALSLSKCDRASPPVVQRRRPWFRVVTIDTRIRSRSRPTFRACT